MSVLILPTICHSSIVIGHWSLVIRQLSLVISHWVFVIRHLSLVTGYGINSRDEGQMTTDKGQMTHA